MTILVIVADASRARIFSAVDKAAPLTETKDLVNTATRLRDQDLIADGHGSGVDSAGDGKHTMGHEKDAHKHQASLFSRQLADEIESERSTGALRRIYIIAPPVFLGVMYLLFMFAINVGSAFIDFFDILSGTLFVAYPLHLLAPVDLPQWILTIVEGFGSGIQTVATFIPVIACLFIGLSLLESSGYLARAAFVVDETKTKRSPWLYLDIWLWS